MGSGGGPAATHRRSERRCFGSKPTAIITGDESPASTDVASASTCFLKPDPQVEALCEHASAPALLVLVDPILDELAAVLVTRPRAPQAPSYRSCIISIALEKSFREVTGVSPDAGGGCVGRWPNVRCIVVE